MVVEKGISRRSFIGNSSLAAAGLVMAGTLPLRAENEGVNNLLPSHIFVSGGNGPEQNMQSVIYAMGGIQALIGPNDIVVIKTNAQQYNQGSANFAAIKAFVKLVVEIPNFTGEVIICDNNHRWPPETKGAWAETFEINSDVPGVTNLMELIDNIRNEGHDNVSWYCWRDTGDSSSRRVDGPQDGDGYVYLTDLVYSNNADNPADYRETMMTYPVFTSSYSGVTIDLKQGAWKNGAFIDQPVKFIMFSGLCRHSDYAGVTSTVKNYFGVVDLTGGSNPATGGKIYQDYYNFHAFAYDSGYPGPVPGMLGGAVGTFLKHVRPADMHITTAEWTGWDDRTYPGAAERTGYICASADPVALDYYCAKYILFPAAVKNNSSKSEYLNPDNSDLPFRQYLDVCYNMGVGNLDEANIVMHTPETPVDLVAFSVELLNKQPVLHWHVVSFEQFYGFEIQRRLPGGEMDHIGFIPLVNNKMEYTYVDDSLKHHGLIEYRLKMIDTTGAFEYSDIISIKILAANTFTLHKNYPNPFNSSTIIHYDLPQNGHVHINVYNIMGARVRNLLAEIKSAGYHKIRWDGRDDSGKQVASGTYLVRADFDQTSQSNLVMYIN